MSSDSSAVTASALQWAGVLAPLLAHSRGGCQVQRGQLARHKLTRWNDATIGHRTKGWGLPEPAGQWAGLAPAQPCPGGAEGQGPLLEAWPLLRTDRQRAVLPQHCGAVNINSLLLLITGSKSLCKLNCRNTDNPISLGRVSPLGSICKANVCRPPLSTS